MRPHGRRLAQKPWRWFPTTKPSLKSYKNLHPQVCSLENVMAAARSAMQGKMSGHAAARFHARWETHAVQLAEELTAGTWQPGPYTYFDIHEPKLRRVAAAPFRDRVVHHALVRVLESIFEKKFIEDSYACRKGKGTHAGVRRCAEFSRRFSYVLKCDLHRYFPSIDHEILLQRIGKTIADRQVMALIQRILETHEDGQRMAWGEDLFDCHILRHGLPIGNLTSQFFANVHLDGFDHFVKQELGVKGYVRYVDDFLRKVRLVARAARGLVEQQREQPARIQPQQQRPQEREQQRGVPSRQALEGALPSHR
jgi:RNA-directed DNA polymerase